jgi:hypothetical protein
MLRLAAVLLLGLVTAAALAWIPAARTHRPVAAIAGVYRPLTPAESLDPSAGWYCTRSSAWACDWYESCIGFDGAMWRSFVTPPGSSKPLLVHRPPPGDPETMPPTWARHALAPWRDQPQPWITQPRQGRAESVVCCGWPLRIFWSISHDQDRWTTAGRPLFFAGELHTPGWLVDLLPTPVEDPTTTSLRAMGVVNLPPPPYQLHLPLKPIWPAFAASTALFASLWWLLLLGPCQIRRALRLQRGRCETCGYDLRATPATSPCPECGRIRTA